MRIIAIRGKNLASLADEFQIDFSVEPLKSAGIYAITGPTGAGKSTLLDALCLALFDATPRMSKARENNVLVPDVNSRTLSQNDTRSILRRGAAEAYAEVDFHALDGHDYRSRWMVRRARGQANGLLQKVEMRLTDLTTGNEVGGTKTELMAHIVQLIGLSFEQFSRSVLLAQGDFATFLKARQAEKAEILEKLTGTEIYSRISVAIYDHWRKAKDDFEQLQARMKDIILLAPEEVEKITAERTNIESALQAEKTTKEQLQTRLKWMEEGVTLQKSLEEAKVQQQALEEERKQAEPRIHTWKLWELVQALREIFVSHRQALAAKDRYDSQLIQLREEERKNGEKAEGIQKSLKQAEQQWNDHKKLMETMRPQLEKAHQLDARIVEQDKRCKEAERQYKHLTEVVVALERDLVTAQQKRKDNETALLQIQAWLDRYKIYQTLIPKVDLIHDLFTHLTEYTRMKGNNAKLAAAQHELLQEEEKRMASLQKESERLRNLLPAEVLNLRARLEEGKPCPVCGSTHHPLVGGVRQESSVMEEELEKARMQTDQHIELLRDAIAKHQADLSRMTALQDMYEQQASDSLKNLQTHVGLLPDWQKWLQEGTLEKHIRRFVDLWNQYTTRLSETRELLGQWGSRMESILKDLDTRKEETAKGKLLCDTLEKECQELKGERAQLLDGKSVDWVSKDLNTTLQTLEKEWKEQLAAMQECVSRQQSLKGTLLQLDHERKVNAEQVTLTHGQIQEWLTAHPEIESMEVLTVLLEKNERWQREEKAYFDGLKERSARWKAVGEERQRLWTQHCEANIYQDNRTQEEIQGQIAELTTSMEVAEKRRVEIMVALDTQHQAEVKIASFRKELEKKEQTYLDWTKLNDLFGSQNGSKFKEIAQGYTLDILVAYANRHLEELSPRYVLQRIPDTLALQIADRDMLGEVRTVHSLSGGESFLVSLALALGLASLSSNRMNVESLFIDEGFGSLDLDTLRVAMEVLERLQTQGRKIGVISHVPEMTERIATRICVVKESNGKSHIELVG